MLSPIHNDLQILIDFLQTPTPDGWLAAALRNIPLLLLDHAHCERKAAATAINLISKYPELPELVEIMSPLAREELLHFEKVLDLMRERNYPFGPLQSCNYAQKMHAHVTKGGCRDRLRDQLIVGAIIEARSCERFYALVPLLDDSQLTRFYSSLVKSEARHFQDYMKLAHLYGEGVEERLEFFLAIENTIILAKDEMFRFHSGVPV
ncbi:tRNA hydroxylase [Legionella birminghamensis]|uniref:tRNA hydroxylase n=1 Tax=Legionella birminghamensis TaxID=28083 RepID=A0A378IHG6_9GAMM|nr:tRNA-(ms[2]io[6]A)-hydroxylase [Legionella birminghamensis]KTC69371.1 tRNA hydroxylase [Legionella birminghamensis]STX31634.1 tRNA-(ms(2)io(6)a)-hydrolase(tRNA hydroxylase) [Legionella birminghamensis]